MSELLANFTGPAPITNTERHSAAVTVMECCGFVAAEAVMCLLMLGLAQPRAAGGFEAVLDDEVGLRTADTLTTAWS